MVSKQLPALPSEARTRHSYSGPSAPVLPPIELPQPLPLSASREFSASVPDVSRTRTSQVEVKPAAPYLGRSFYLAPRARLSSEDGRLLYAGSRATWTGEPPRAASPTPSAPAPRAAAPTRVPVPPLPAGRIPVPSAPPASYTSPAPSAPPASVRAPLEQEAPASQPPYAAPWSHSAPPAVARVAPPTVAPLDQRPHTHAQAAMPVPTTAAPAPSNPCDADIAAIEPPISATAAAGLVQPCLMIEVRAVHLRSTVIAAAGSTVPHGCRPSCSSRSRPRMHRTGRARAPRAAATWPARC